MTTGLWILAAIYVCGMCVTYSFFHHETGMYELPALMAGALWPLLIVLVLGFEAVCRVASIVRKP